MHSAKLKELLCFIGNLCENGIYLFKEDIDNFIKENDIISPQPETFTEELNELEEKQVLSGGIHDFRSAPVMSASKRKKLKPGSSNFGKLLGDHIHKTKSAHNLGVRREVDNLLNLQKEESESGKRLCDQTSQLKDQMRDAQQEFDNFNTRLK